MKCESERGAEKRSANRRSGAELRGRQGSDEDGAMRVDRDWRGVGVVPLRGA